MTQTAPVLPYADPTDALAERRAVTKVLLRLIPLMILLYLFNYLDRVNVSFAKKPMSADLPWLSDAVYGMGAGLFFVGYFLFEVPSNLIMERVGARVWMARIMVTWGLISVAMMFVTEKWHFYALRLLLGIAEAGFFPGMLLYMTYWIPRDQRARAAAWFLTSTALSGVVGGPVSDVVLGLGGGGLRPWQWLFLVEGVPSVLLGLGILFVLNDRPAQARWLTADEKRALAGRLAAERAAMPPGRHGLREGLADARVLALCLLYGTIIFGFYVINYWTPDLIRSTLAKDSVAPVGALTAIPFFAATVSMSVVGVWADRSGRRRLAIGGSAAVAAVGYAVAANAHAPWLMLAALSVAAAGTWSTMGPFWSLPSRFLSGTAAAAGIGLINSVGNLLGGYLGPTMMGQLKERTGNFQLGLWISSGALAMTVVITCLLGRLLRRGPAAEPHGFGAGPVGVPVGSEH